jgi:hypothetical protein
VGLLAGVLALVPSLAFANAGTPLMWAGMLYLCGGNVLLGMAEGFVLAKWFGLPVKRCMGWMIVANLLSAWVGQALLPNAFLAGLGLDTLPHLRTGLVVALIAAWVLTLLIEWPFMALCFRGASGWLRKSVMATLAIQTVSCLVIGAFFLSVSYFTLLTEHRIVPSEELPWPPGLTVYHLDPDGVRVRAFDTDTGDSRVVHRMDSVHQSQRSVIFFAEEPNSKESRVHRLLAGRLGRSTEDVAAREDLGVEVDTSSIVRMWDLSERNQEPRYPFGSAWHPYDLAGGPVSINKPPADLQGFRQGFWAAEGLDYTIGDEEKERSYQLSIETPYAMWGVRQTMHVGDGILMFVLGNDQICLLDMRTQRVALKMRGFGAMAVPKDAVVEVSGSASPAATGGQEGEE